MVKRIARKKSELLGENKKNKKEKIKKIKIKK